MKKLTQTLIVVSLFISCISCDKDDDPEVALYTKNDASKLVVKTVTTNLGTGLKDLYTDWFTDSVSRAAFCRDFTHSSRFMDDNSGYIFVESVSGFNISHPENPQLEGTSTQKLPSSKTGLIHSLKKLSKKLTLSQLENQFN